MLHGHRLEPRAVPTETDQLARLKAALAERYTVERELGHGGMATVYLAQDLKLDRRVAVKVLRPELAAALGPERFLREVRITARLNHPHVLPLLDSGAAGEFLYYSILAQADDAGVRVAGAGRAAPAARVVPQRARQVPANLTAKRRPNHNLPPRHLSQPGLSDARG
jgi:protein kinase-like protein